MQDDDYRPEYFSFYRSYYDSMLLMSNEAAVEYVEAMCRYVFYGEEPKFKHQTAAIGYLNAKPLLDQTIARCKGRHESAKRREQDA